MKLKRFAEKIYRLIALIPPGKAATYGQLAFLAGEPRGARMAGQVLSRAPENSGLPYHRVVSASGRTVPHWPEQRVLLEQEGAVFRENGTVDLKICLWKPRLAELQEIEDKEGE